MIELSLLPQRLFALRYILRLSFPSKKLSEFLLLEGYKLRYRFFHFFLQVLNADMAGKTQKEK